jgi:hypothetical protein
MRHADSGRSFAESDRSVASAASSLGLAMLLLRWQTGRYFSETNLFLFLDHWAIMPSFVKISRRNACGSSTQRRWQPLSRMTRPNPRTTRKSGRVPRSGERVAGSGVHDRRIETKFAVRIADDLSGLGGIPTGEISAIEHLPLAVRTRLGAKCLTMAPFFVPWLFSRQHWTRSA